MHNFTFDVRFWQWYVQFPHTAKNLCPTLFPTATVKPKRRGRSLLHRTIIIIFLIYLYFTLLQNTDKMVRNSYSYIIHMATSFHAY